MAENIKKEELVLDDTIKENAKGQVILGRLTGPCADFIVATRNGRKYDEELWDKVFSDPIVNEYFEAGGIPGELDHPTDRLETCSEKIAIMMPEKPQKNDKGQLIASFDILDTPNGRIAYTLAKYGYKLGISSRGDGDTYIGEDGEEYVNEDTYNFQAFDLVLLPAVKAARLQLEESLQNNQSFKQALNESLKNASVDDRKVMEETLNHLNIKLNKDSNTDKVKNKTNFVANNVGTNMVKELQESLLKQKELKTQIAQLQEKLSVCDAKESKYEDDIAKYKVAIKNLSENLTDKNSLENTIKELNESLNKKDKIIKNLRESRRNNREIVNNQLKESLENKDQIIERQKRTITQLNEQLDTLNKEKDDVKKLNENLFNLKQNSKIKENQLLNKLEESNNKITKYKTIAKTAVNRYIESEAIRIGVSSTTILERLPRDYSFNDIDRVCEDLTDFKLRTNDLPFVLNENTKIKVMKHEEPLLKNNLDDTIDDSLLKLAGVN